MTQSIGIVGAKEVNNNGKQKICIDGQWYYAGGTDVSNLNVGQRIDFEWNTFGAQNNLRGLQSWGLTPNQPTPEEIAAAKPQERKPWAGKGGGGKPPPDRGLEIDLQCMRFMGQTVAGALEKDLIRNQADLQAWVKGAYEAIKFAKSWGATAPAPAQQTATSAGSPSQTPQGSSTDTGAGKPVRVRPTGKFGFGNKHRETAWNQMTANDLNWFIDKSTAPSDVKTRCKDELWFREQDKPVADVDPPGTDDFDDDIPF